MSNRGYPRNRMYGMCSVCISPCRTPPPTSRHNFCFQHSFLLSHFSHVLINTNYSPSGTILTVHKNLILWETSLYPFGVLNSVKTTLFRTDSCSLLVSWAAESPGSLCFELRVRGKTQSSRISPTNS